MKGWEKLGGHRRVTHGTREKERTKRPWEGSEEVVVVDSNGECCAVA